MTKTLYGYSLCLVYYIENKINENADNVQIQSKCIQVKKAFVKNETINKLKISKVGFITSFIFIKKPDLDYEVVLRYDHDTGFLHKKHLQKDKETVLQYAKYNIVDVLKLE